MEQIVSQLKERFQLLVRIRMAAKDSPFETEALPLFFGLLLAVMDSKHKEPCCFVLPSREKTAHLAAVVYGLSKFIEDYNRLDRQIAETKFSPGQNVFVRPPNKVYRYQGIHKDNPAWIELGIIGKTDWQTFPLSDIRRLEATTAERPAGKLAGIPRNVRESSFDRLMEVDTAGNFGAFLNHVLLLDYKSEFQDTVNSIYLQKVSQVPEMPLLGELLPFGSISQSDKAEIVSLRKWNFLNYKCEPLVAVTSSQEKMVAACKAAEQRSKVVIVNGLGLLANHLQTYDEIAASQRLVIVAEHDEQEQMQAFADRGCKFWWLGQREISMGVDNCATNETTGKIFGTVFRSAKNEARMEVESDVCEDRLLNAIAVRLVTVDEAVKADTIGTTRRIVSKVYRLLNDVASLFKLPTAEELHRFAGQLTAIQSEIDHDRHWIGEPAATLEKICQLFDESLSATYCLGQTKGYSLVKVLHNMRGISSQVAIFTRNINQQKQLDNWLCQRGFCARVFTSNTVPENASFDCIICITWPGSDAFQRMARRFLAPRIKVIGYAFENNWLKQCNRKLRHRPQLPNFSKSDKTEIMKNGATVHISWPEEPETDKVETNPPTTGFSIWAFENQIRAIRKGGRVLEPADDTVAAKYIGFKGDSYAYITAGHNLPILTDLLAATENARQKTPMKEVEQVRVGDFTVFRDGGNKDVIQELADHCSETMQARCAGLQTCGSKRCTALG